MHEIVRKSDTVNFRLRGVGSSDFAADKPDRFFAVTKFWIDKTSGVALDLNTSVPSLLR